MDADLRQVPEIFLGYEIAAFSFGKVPENSCLYRGPETSDYIETRSIKGRNLV
ncbi:hypothetical protein [Acutalibacter muris]|uniref:hypothetical protein n=1 Tax=Acutalibacter muris TaxID=1796620 RepID=UPI00272BC896|nr:hypothetical protein [Acutalibacter muris]